MGSTTDAVIVTYQMTLPPRIHHTHSVLLCVRQALGSWFLCSALQDTASFSDVCFRFIQPFFLRRPERDKGLLFPSPLLTLCWLGTRGGTFQRSVRAPHRVMLLSLCLISSPPLHFYPEPNLFVCLFDQLQVGVLILPSDAVQMKTFVSIRNPCAAVDPGVSHKTPTQISGRS